MSISFQKLFYSIATVFAVFAILILGKGVLIPLSIALLVAFILLPVANRFEKWSISRMVSALLSVILAILLIGGILFLFSAQIIKLSDEFSDFRAKIISLFAEVTVYINRNFGFVDDLGRDELVDIIKNWVKSSFGTLVSQSFSNTISFLTGLFISIIFTFLLLIYRTGFVQAFARFGPEKNRKRLISMFKRIQQVGQKYLSGMLVLTVIIGLANSIGLLLIGVDNPFLFGFLGAALSIIPYVGTILGAVIPILYTFLSYEALWMPLAVLILFYAVQQIADNILSPIIVGGNLNVNALTVILSLIVGASVWGVAGMVLFLPFAAMLKVVCEEYDELKPVALLMEDQNKGKGKEDMFVFRWFEKVKSFVSNKSSEKKADKGS